MASKRPQKSRLKTYKEPPIEVISLSSRGIRRYKIPRREPKPTDTTNSGTDSATAPQGQSSSRTVLPLDVAIDLPTNSLYSQSGLDYKSCDNKLTPGRLISLIDKQFLEEKQTRDNLVKYQFEPGDDDYAKEELCTLSLSVGGNIIVSQLREDGVLASGCSGKVLCITELGVPVEKNCDQSVPSLYQFHSAGVLCLDFHPHKKNLLLTGSMDKTVCLLDLDKGINHIPCVYKNHTKYVVRVKWSPSGEYFVSASYDKSICIYRYEEAAEDNYKLHYQVPLSGCVEAITFKKDADILLVAVRGDHRLHIFDIARSQPTESTFLNMNALGDDYVSFTAMDISVSPNGNYILVSTDKNRLILFDIDTGQQVANFYGSLNDEYSQPRHCWHPTGKYFYATSDDKSISIFEVAIGKVIARLKGHQGRVRDLSYSNQLKLLVSSGFDGCVRFWH